MELYQLFLKILNSSYTFQYVSRTFNTITSNAPGHPSYWKKFLKLLFDILLGIVFYIVLTSQSDSRQIATSFLLVAGKMKNSLKQLLQWLMGAPAGLKLNKELSYFLGNFFTYHVDLWMTYLLILRGILPEIITALSCSCCFGVSLFSCLLNDVINLLTVHLYCFYVYAANLYYVQFKGLVSLARLFTGKKWNVLRLRVDSITYQPDQLILGTILFTILLFLLPTTLLYYIVFTTTRLSILITQTFISTLVEAMTTFPLYELGRSALGYQDNTETDEIEITYTKPTNTSLMQHGADATYHQRNDGSANYTVKSKIISFTGIIKREYSFQTPNFKDVIGNVLTGVIVKNFGNETDS